MKLASLIRSGKAMVPVLLLLGVAGAAVTAFAAKDPGPQAIHLREVAPQQGKVGDILKAYGDSLNAERVLEVYLTNGFMDYRVEVMEQTEHWFTFRIPAGITAGQFRVAVVASHTRHAFGKQA